jgi:hypothetical protein
MRTITYNLEFKSAKGLIQDVGSCIVSSAGLVLDD